MLRLHRPLHNSLRTVATGLLWNLSVRDDGIEEQAIARGLPDVLAAAAEHPELPVGLRLVSARYLHVLAEASRECFFPPLFP